LETVSQMTPVEMYVNDVFTVPGSLAGLPAVSVPVQVDGDIVGLQIVGQVGMDLEVLEAAGHLEEILRS
jgi:aspartyl-tRNA(Asn)/glutamyl-tRNA(Gln) amidotransferase subunit A